MPHERIVLNCQVYSPDMGIKEYLAKKIILACLTSKILPKFRSSNLRNSLHYHSYTNSMVIGKTSVRE